MYMNGTLRSWMHYCDIRTGIETQKEHRQIALECATVIDDLLAGNITTTEDRDAKDARHPYCTMLKTKDHIVCVD